MLKRGLIVALCMVLFSFSVSAIHSVSVTSVNSTLITVELSSPSNMYGYEVNFSKSSFTLGAVTFFPILSDGFTTSSGSNQKGDYLYVYESRLDSTQAGISTGGELFNVSYTGTLTLKGSTAILNDGTVEHVSYNADGTVSDSSSTSSSSGTTSTTTTVSSGYNVVVTPDFLDMSVILGRGDVRNLLVENLGSSSVTIDVSVEGLEGLASVDKDEIILGPGESTVVSLNVGVVTSGLEVGRIVFKVGSQEVAAVGVVIDVRSEGFLFDSSISLSGDSRSVLAGNVIKAQVDLQQVGPQEKIDVVTTYVIKDFGGNDYWEESETFFVLGEKNFIKEFPTDALPVGKYILGMEIVYPGAFATSSTQFSIVGTRSLFGEGSSLTTGIIVGAVVILGLIALIAAMRMIGKRSFRGRRKTR